MNVFGGDTFALLSCGGKKGPASKHIRPAQQPSGSLVHRGNRLVGEQVAVGTGEVEVVCQVCAHLFAIEGLKAGLPQHPGGERSGGMVQQLVDQMILAAQDDRQHRVRVKLQLCESVQLGEDLQAEEVLKRLTLNEPDFSRNSALHIRRAKWSNGISQDLR